VVLKSRHDRRADKRQYERATTDDEHNYKLIESIERNAHHYIEIFSRAVDQCLPPPTKDLKYAASHESRARS
jgi:DNA replication licensing factor MCM7